MPWVKLNGNRAATLKRAVRDDKGNIIAKMEFPRHEAVDVPEEYMSVVAADILSGALLPMVMDPVTSRLKLLTLNEGDRQALREIISTQAMVLPPAIPEPPPAESAPDTGGMTGGLDLSVPPTPADPPAETVIPPTPEVKDGENIQGRRPRRR